MLTVGTDTYAAVSEADDYIRSHYLSTSTDRTAWDILSESDKEILLRNACVYIEAQTLSGRKLNSEQTLSFPRLQNGTVSDDRQIKAAQIEQALFINSSAFSDYEHRKALISQGVKSFSLGDLSESYSDNVVSISKNSKTLASKACSLLSKWIGGSYYVR